MTPGSEDPLEKEMTTHSSNLAWRIPWTEEPGRLQSMGSQRVGHDLVTKEQLIDEKEELQLTYTSSHTPGMHHMLATTEI